MRSLPCLLGAALCALGAAALSAAPPAAADPADSSFTLQDPRITESSGLAASRAHPGVYWTHNDSDDGPYVYAVDGRTGRTVATVTLRGVDPRDVEAVAVGPDGAVHVGDIGDNLGGTWPEVWIYRFDEPEELRDTTVDPVRHTVRYDGGPRDAESLLVHPETGRTYLISKGEDGGGLYEGPQELAASGVNTFRRIAGIDLWATDAAFSPDGTRLVVRGYFSGALYRWADGGPRRLGALAPPLQRQGESVTFTADGRTVLYGTEGANSRVEAVPLRGGQLPESAARADDGRGGGDDEGGADGGNAGDRQDGDGGDTAAQDGDEEGGSPLLLAVAAATVLAVALRRLARRG